jgi:predicted XRE-type DNA-binding protein
LVPASTSWWKITEVTLSTNSSGVEGSVRPRLALAANELLKARKLKQREIGALLGVPQPKVSALKNYRLDQFSVERLMEFLTALNQDVEITIRPIANASETGHISVLAIP